MRISVIHPTRNRPKQAYQTWSNWYDKADNVFEYILSIDEDDKYDYLEFPCKVLTRPNKSAIEAINNAVKFITGDLIIVISDDFDAPDHWDTLLLNELKDKTDFLLKTDDGLQPTLVTLPILDRVYYNRFGYVYHPDYKHMWADTEMTAVALMIGKCIKSDLSFPHLHYSTGKSPKDEINVRNDATWKQGERLFNERLKTNFGITEPVMAYSDIKWK